MVAQKNYWNTKNGERNRISSIIPNMVFDATKDINMRDENKKANYIKFGIHSAERPPANTLSSERKSLGLDNLCAKEAEASTPEEAPPCTLGGMILQNMRLSPSLCSVYNVVGDIQVPDGVTIDVDPGTKIEGKHKKLKVEGNFNVNGSDDSKVIINNLNIEPAGYPENGGISISYANIKRGGITFNSRTRTFHKGFTLKNSNLEYTKVYGQYARGDIIVENNIFKGYGFECNDCGLDPVNYWGKKNAGRITIDGNTFTENNSGVQIYNHKLEGILINNNKFERSRGVYVYPHWTITNLKWYSSWVSNPLIEIKKNTFKNTYKGIYAQNGIFDISENNFIESPGIEYHAGEADYEKGNYDFKINNNTFCRQKGEWGNTHNEYAIKNIRKIPGSSSSSIVQNNFCSTDKFAVRIGTTSNDTGMVAKYNFWNTGNHFTIDSKMVYDRADDINIYSFIPYVPFLSAPHGESSGVSPKVSQTLPQCTVVSSNRASSICNQVCEGISPGDDEPEPEPVDLTVEMMLTFPPPLIIPRSTPGGDDAILQASFNISVGHQWEGHLKKYKLKKDGSIGDLQWDAGKLLNDNKQASSRNIFTVGDGLTVFGDNNFKESNVEKLKPLLYGDGHANIDNEDAKKLINFVRGVDVFDEFEGKAERWKLGDIYHAELAVMGAPTAKITDNPDKKHTDAYYRFSKKYDAFYESRKNRTKLVFAGANDGMLHAFRLDTGEELWAFIPPMLNARLKDMVSSETNKSMSIFGVDGTPVVKDIFVDGRWKTIVMGGLGMGGHGYYALDVTDPDSPEHLFSFAYDPDTKTGTRWVGRNGQKSTTDSFDKLGEAWSKPLILRIPISGQSRWVAVMGGGFNGGNIREYGSVIYIVDLENSGQLLHEIEVEDLSGNKIFNSVPAFLTAITPDSSDKADYTGALVYFSDLEGKLWKLNLTNQDVAFSMKQVFDAEADNLNGRYSYHSVAPAMGTDNTLRMFYGTGDLQKLMSGSQNIDNRFFGLKEGKFPLVDTETKFTESSLLDTTGDEEACSTDDDNGWKIKLKPGEKTTSKAMVSYGTVFFSRYEPLTTDQCALGKTSITGVDYQCGSEKFTVDLGTGIATVPTLYRGKLYLGISGDSITDFELPEGWVKKDNLLMGKPGDLSSWQGVKMKSWREEF